MVSDTKKKLVNGLILTAIIVLIGIIIPLTLGLGTQSIYDEGVGDLIDFYAKFYWSLLVIWGVLLTFIIIKKNNKYGDSIGFAEIGEKPSLSFFKNFSQLQITILSFIIFPTIFLLANFLRLGGFTSLKVLPQQFSKTQSLLFSTLLIPASENLLLGAIVSLVILGLVIIAIKYKFQYSDYLTYLYVGLFIIAGIFGVAWHSTAYPNSDIAKYVVFFFWGIGAVISVAVGSWIPFLAMHMSNNFFIDFSRLYSSDFMLTVTIGFILGMCVLYYYLYRGKLFGEKKVKGVFE